MELQEALVQIDTIRAQVSRTEIFRGYRAATVAGTGILGLAAAAVQPIWVPQADQHPRAFVDLWVSSRCQFAPRCARVNRELVSPRIALGSAADAAGDRAIPALPRSGRTDDLGPVELRDRGAGPSPGLWAIIFGLGMFAAARQLPPAIRVVAFYYLVAGVSCFVWARGDAAFSPWAMAGTFGVGQLLAAAVLYWTLERTHAEP